MTGKSTVLNLTNHSYFNLKGENSKTDITNHYFRTSSDSILETDDGLIPSGKYLKTKDTPFDFYNKFRKIGERIDEKTN